MVLETNLDWLKPVFKIALLSTSASVYLLRPRLLRFALGWTEISQKCRKTSRAGNQSIMDYKRLQIYHELKMEAFIE